ncbi:Ribonuclease Z, mitochondrial [Anthophora plagiata]
MLHFNKYLYKCIIRNADVRIKAYHTKSFSCLYKLLAMQQKKKLKHFGNNFNATLKVIGSGALGTPAFLYLLTDQSNYLFNCGEGTQRLSQEHHCKLSKLNDIFLTTLSWKTVGGIPGLLLTAQDNGLTTVNIHCPDGLNKFVETIQTFTYLPNLKISYPSTYEHKVYKNNVMTVSYVHITKSLKTTEECSLHMVNEKQCYSNVNGKRVINEEVEINERKKTRSTSNVICYICEIHPRPGKLVINKCIDLGISPGPVLSLLKRGLDVTKEDGTIIYSKDVRHPDSPKTTFIVAECPTEEYLDSFLHHPDFLKYQQAGSKEQDEICCIFHFTPENVFTNQRYQNWIAKFSSKTEHIVLNNENTCMGSEAVYKNQYLLNMLHPEIFPLLPKNNINENEIKNNHIHRARAIQTLQVRPAVKSIIQSTIHNEPHTYLEQVSQIHNFQKALNELKVNIHKKSIELNLNNTSDYPRIIMLGTGCSVPNKVRNTSSILLRVEKNNSILLDCGEGTLGQIIRFFGLSESNNILRSIKAVYISHIHADHHLGLIGLLLRRKQITSDKLYLLIPTCMAPWLNFYNDRFESISQQYTLVKNSDLYMNQHKLSAAFENTFLNFLNVKEISTVFVEHCKQSYGIAVILKDNTKITYSGDTMFSKNLIKLGKDCDLLIHEATMEDGLETLAKRKLHSTTSEAINAGKFMNAKFTLLTHFSQRYSKIPYLPKRETNVGLAYDHMEIKLSQLPLLPLFHPCIKIMFNEYNKVLEN